MIEYRDSFESVKAALIFYSQERTYVPFDTFSGHPNLISQDIGTIAKDALKSLPEVLCGHPAITLAFLLQEAVETHINPDALCEGERQALYCVLDQVDAIRESLEEYESGDHRPTDPARN